MEIIEIRKRDADRNHVEFNMEVNGEMVGYAHGSVPSDLDEAGVIKFLEGQSDEMTLQILRKQYPEAKPDLEKGTKPDLEKGTKLELMQGWITKGCKNSAVIDADTEEVLVPETVIVKVAVPVKVASEKFDRKKVSVASIAKLDALIAKVPEAAILKELLIGK